MRIESIPLGHIGANCYMLSSENAAIVIDPGKSSQYVENFLLANSAEQRIILLTHAHFDHIGAADELRNKTGVKIAIGKKDAKALGNTYLTLSDRFRARVKPFDVDIMLSDGEKILIGDINIKAIETPGHTPGGMCFYIENCLFSGDTLFFDSVGRTDFPGSDYTQLRNSLSKLFTYFEDDVKVYPGHGEATTIGRERCFNPFVREI